MTTCKISPYTIYKNRLLDIGKSSGVINLRTIDGKEYFDIASFAKKLYQADLTEFLDNKIGELQIIKNCSRISQETKKSIQSLLELQTKKSEELYLGYPFVSGYVNKDTAINAPLFFVNVIVKIKKNEVVIQRKNSFPVKINKQLLLTILERSEKLIDKEIFSKIYNFNSNVNSVYEAFSFFEQTITKVTTKKTIVRFSPISQTNAKLRLSGNAIIAPFHISTAIISDYEELEEKCDMPDCLRVLITDVDATKIKNVSKLTFVDSDLDYTQKKALNRLSETNNLVVYGPPGTGKSHLICNFIKTALINKKKILIVSQKKTALDVIYSRMLTLSEYALNLSDAENEKKEIINKYLKTFDSIVDSHTIVTESARENISLVKKNIKNEITKIDSVVTLLYQNTDYGLSLADMYRIAAGFEYKEYDTHYTKFLNSKLARLNYKELTSLLSDVKNKKLPEVFEKIRLLEEQYSFSAIVDANNFNEYDFRLAIAELNECIKNPIKLEKTYFNDINVFLTFLANCDDENPNAERLTNLLLEVKCPQIVRDLKTSLFPLFWLAFPFVLYRYMSAKKQTKKDLIITENVILGVLNKYPNVKKILSPNGYRLFTSALFNNNAETLKNILVAVNKYRDNKNVITFYSESGDTEKELCEFIYDNFPNRQNYNDIAAKIIKLRTDFELRKYEKDYLELLSATENFQNAFSALSEKKSQITRFTIQAICELLTKTRQNVSKKALSLLKTSLSARPANENCFKDCIYNNIDLLLELYPCFIATPQAVSEYLPLRKGLFDYIIFDEASQIYPENAVPCIYRANSVIVAGDDKQLKPASSFMKKSNELALELGDDGFDSLSLLDLASAKYNNATLLYHYRSLFCELIDFSNEVFYNGKLVVAPNARLSNEFKPIERIMVKGVWENRKNEAEAKAVLLALKRLLNESEPPSIGIITFNIEQCELIKKIIENELSKNPNLRKKYDKINSNAPIFVKNLENVQGDERDVIILSVGYAKDSNGKVCNRFGSLSVYGGENRLNVAITRARKQTIVVTSIEPEQLCSTNTKSIGAKILKKYLIYAREVSVGKCRYVDNAKSLAETPTSFFTKKLILGLSSALTERNYEVSYVERNGIILRIKQKDAPLIYGIMLDLSENYNPDIVERELDKENFLKQKGWNIIRIWSRDWWQSPDAVLERIDNIVKNDMSQLQTDSLSLTAGM